MLTLILSKSNYDYFIGTDDSRVKLEESNVENDLGSLH